jgi:hypothetical protein
MYSLPRRLQLSLIFPILLTIKFVARLAQLQSTRTITQQSLTITVLTFIFELAITYFLSVLFFSIETLVRTYITDQDSSQSLQVKEELKRASFFGKVDVLAKWDQADSNNRITQSIIFQAALVLFSVYAVTSSNTIVGVGVSLGILLQILVEQIKLLKDNKDISSWFWQIKTVVPRDIQVIYVSAVTIIFIALSSVIFR